VEGKTPEFNTDWGQPQITLAPKELVTIWLAEGQWLRIRHPNKPFPTDAWTFLCLMARDYMR